MHALAGLGNGPANRVPAGFIAGSTGHGVEHRRPSDAAGADAHACGVPDEPAAEGDGRMSFTAAEPARRLAYDLYFPDFGTTSTGPRVRRAAPSG